MSSEAQREEDVIPIRGWDDSHDDLLADCENSLLEYFSKIATVEVDFEGCNLDGEPILKSKRIEVSDTEMDEPEEPIDYNADDVDDDDAALAAYLSDDDNDGESEDEEEVDVQCEQEDYDNNEDEEDDDDDDDGLYSEDIMQQHLFGSAAADAAAPDFTSMSPQDMIDFYANAMHTMPAFDQPPAMYDSQESVTSDSDDEEGGGNVMRAKPRKVKLSTAAVKPFGRPVKGSGYGPPKKKPQQKSNTNALSRNKEMLTSIAEKRRAEEEAAMKQLELAEIKRKKFKEALVQKALQSRTLSLDAALHQPAQPPEEEKKVLTTYEEQEHEEELAKQQVGELRKKFKKHHKQMLRALRQKKKEEELKAQEAAEREAKIKEKLRLRNLRMAERRESKINDEHPESSESETEAAAAVAPSKPKPSKRPPRQQEHQRVVSADGAPVLPVSAAAGSGISAVRSMSQGNDSTQRRVRTRAHPPERVEAVQESEAAEDDTGANVELREMRKLQAKKRKEKIEAELAAVAEQRRLAVEKAKRKEERAKKRAVLLATRVLLEATERKLMAAEDKYANPANLDSRVTKAHAGTDASDAKPVAKVTPEMAEALVKRLQMRQMKTKEGVEALANCSVQARDFADWKRKNAVPPEGQVFTMTGWYPCVKQALLDRGWYFNPESSSPYCDMKWTLRSSDVSQETLQPWQLTNHFLKNVAITTKVGLLKSLRQLVWIADTHPREIIPRGYDLSNPQETQEFIDDFRLQKAECLLKHIYKLVTGRDQACDVPPVAIQSSEEQSEEHVDHCAPVPTPRYDVPSAIVDINAFMVNEAVFRTACEVLQRYLRPYFTDCLDDPAPEGCFDEVMSPVEWEVLSTGDLLQPFSLADTPPTPVDEFLREAEAQHACKRYGGAEHRANKKQKRNNAAERSKAVAQSQRLVPLGVKGLQDVHTILCQLIDINGTQLNMNGKGLDARNMWIVKPAAKSRGRGIMTFSDLNKLLSYVDYGKGSAGSALWIVQKYMERPLTIARRKFDLRQWVLVTAWNPLQIYFYNECYARFGVEEYDTSDASLENSFVHLVNNSIGKESENFNRIITAENGAAIEGYMMSFEQFTDYCKFASGRDMMAERIYPRMKEIVKWSLMCAVDAIEHRKNSWELYGFDFMIDEDYNAWLIEINSSPACDYSTKVTERYVQKALVELLTVVLDTRAWDAQNRKTRGEKPDTGGWECIYRGQLLETPAASFGVDMSVRGEAMKVPRRPQPSVPAVPRVYEDIRDSVVVGSGASESNKQAASIYRSTSSVEMVASQAPSRLHSHEKRAAPQGPVPTSDVTSIARKVDAHAARPKPTTSRVKVVPHEVPGSIDDSDAESADELPRKELSSAPKVNSSGHPNKHQQQRSIAPVPLKVVSLNLDL